VTSKSCHLLLLYFDVMSSTVAVIFAIRRVVNNYNIETEPRFLNQTKPNSFQTEFEFLKNQTETKQKFKKSVLHIPTLALLHFVNKNCADTMFVVIFIL